MTSSARSSTNSRSH